MMRYHPTGFAKCIDTFLSYMITRKTVALFTDYKHAKEDVIFEMITQSNADEETAKAIREVIDLYEKNTYIEEYWNEL